MKTGRYDQATAACVKAIELDANSLRRTWSSRQNGASRPLPGDRTLIDDFLDRAIFHGNSVEMFIKNPIGKDGDPYLHAAILLGLGLATRGRTVADQGDLEALRDIEGRIEDELRRLEKMEKHNEGIEKVRALTKRVVTDARRASEIIERIRSMVSHRVPEQKLLSIEDVINDSLGFLRDEFQSRGISLSLDLASELPQIVGDRTQLQQVVVNLATNAVQAMTQSGRVRRSIFVQAMLSDPETLCCTVEDSGPGIDPEHLPRLFETFFTTKHTGMGMGLAKREAIPETERLDFMPTVC